MPGFEESLESVEKNELLITPEQRQVVMDYLKANSDNAIGEDLEAATEEEITLAERLLALELPGGDWDKDRQARFHDSNMTADVELRNEAFARAGFNEGDQVEIRRHDVILGSLGQLPVKIINLVQVPEGERNPSNTIPVKDGVVFLGKITFDGKGESVYVPLSPEEKERVGSFLDKRAETEEK